MGPIQSLESFKVERFLQLETETEQKRKHEVRRGGEILGQKDPGKEGKKGEGPEEASLPAGGESNGSAVARRLTCIVQPQGAELCLGPGRFCAPHPHQGLKRPTQLRAYRREEINVSCFKQPR